MGSKQALIIVLLVVSVLFSVASILLTMSIDVSSPIKVPVQYSSPSVGSSASGGVGLVVQPSAGGLP